MKSPTRRHLKKLHQKAYQAFNDGQLTKANDLFAKLVVHFPDNANYHYMQGLIAKNRGDWQLCVSANLTAIELQSTQGQTDIEAECWNGAIGATALHDWATARELWEMCGVDVGQGDGEIVGDFGQAVVRLNAWENGECVYGTRLDPVRMRIDNVPFPQSGYQFGDIVLHDGASTGTRQDGRVPVFNAFGLWQRSPYLTFTVFLVCDEDSLDELLKMGQDRDIWGENWSKTVRFICLKCSYGDVAHSHDNVQNEQGVGFGAKSHDELQKLLHDWQQKGDNRMVKEVLHKTYEPSKPTDGRVWWVWQE
ncbi:tetratricopeptide repeat protein [Moraxella oblonga]|uniref:tetratricopeptide repeat protein n=1 Tax=Moraxella oblonga TaxID=200413 RepID=UPI0008331D99|nr:hypothetical protein [Moraxella oblonga]